MSKDEIDNKEFANGSRAKYIMSKYKSKGIIPGKETNNFGETWWNSTWRFAARPTIN